MQRPVAQRLPFTELLLGKLDGVILTGRIDLDRALADLALPAVLAEPVVERLAKEGKA